MTKEQGTGQIGGVATDEETSGDILSPEAILEALSSQAHEAALFPASAKTHHFFAFDLLLDQALVGRYIKALLPAHIVRLPHHRLIWPYYYAPAGSVLPTIERTNREADCVWGMLYHSNGKDFKPLERYLKVPHRYHRHSINTVDRGGRRFPAFTYVLTTRDDEPRQPSADYLDQLIALAQARGLPESWIEYLDRCKAVEQP